MSVLLSWMADQPNSAADDVCSFSSLNTVDCVCQAAGWKQYKRLVFQRPRWHTLDPVDYVKRRARY